MEKVIDIQVPKSWQELTQKQLGYVYRTLTDIAMAATDTYDISAMKAKMRVFALFHFAKLRIVSISQFNFEVKHRKYKFKLTHNEIASLARQLEWLDDIPQFPVRLDKIGKGKCLYPADISGLPFGHWLALENLWIGYLSTSSDDCLKAMINILYENPNPIGQPELLSMFYWWSAVKSNIQKMFPSFFRPSPPSAEISEQSLTASYNSQIRALTKGDVTKEDQILHLDTYRALAELDALAREYDEIKKINDKS